MKKLEKKQVPQFVALAAITAVGLGYTAYQLLGSGSQPRAATAAPAPAATPASGPATAVSVGASAMTNPAGTAAAGTPPVKALAQLTTLPPSFTADPFRPVFTPQSDRSAPPPSPAPRPYHAAAPSVPPPPAPEQVDLNAPPLPPSGEWTPRALAADFPRTQEVVPDQSAPSAPAQRAPAPLTRPVITLTGVIQGSPSVAILRGAQDERQVVRVNDRVAGRYVVKSISPDGVLLAAAEGSRPDRWFLPLGADPKGKGL